MIEIKSTINQSTNIKIDEASSLAVLDGAANVLDQLDDGAFPDPAGLDPVVELSRQHGVLSRNGVREKQPVPLLRAPNQFDVQHLH